MAEHCCQNKSEDLKKLAVKQSAVLVTVLIVNLMMFFVEMYSGWISKSLALSSDSLDMFGDALAYGSSLYVVGLSPIAKARSAQFKAWLMLILGIVVLIQAAYRFFHAVPPDSAIMGGIGLVALAANLACLWLLTRHKDDDINFSSVWVCSRNDIIANLAVLAAAVIVTATHSPWPDLVVGFGIALLFTKSALGILNESKSVLSGAVG